MPVNTVAMAEMLGITPRRLQQLARSGLVPRDGRGKYDVEAVKAAYGEFIAKSEAAHRADENWKKARLRRVAAQVDLLEMKVERMRGQLLPREGVEQDWALMRTIAGRHLRKLPDMIQTRCPGLSGKVIELVAKEVEEILADTLPSGRYGKGRHVEPEKGGVSHGRR